ncbi:MAG: hydantoinase/oxoprolinase family protein [Anaerolineae bacterium]
MKRLAVDVGGTFTDFVLLSEDGAVKIEKAASLPDRPDDVFFEGITRLGLDLRALETIIHGSTLVINTIVQSRGARIGLITTQGFRDVIEIARGNRLDIYDLFYKQPEPLVPRYLRFEVAGRLNYKGEELTPLDEEAVREATRQLKAQDVQSIAVCFFHAYANPTHELRTAALIHEVFPEAYVSLSHAVSGEWREYERTSTSVLNAYVMPRMATYLTSLEHRLRDQHYDGALNVVQSTGGMLPSAGAQQTPIRTLESGPAGGVIGSAALGAALGYPNVIGADVGGTTFDVSLVVAGHPLEKTETQINRRPVLCPTLDINSIGAGGGSIAWLNEVGSLRVGPQSAQAVPGPVCYGKGGTEPTVTDAQVVLGRIDPDYFLGHRMQLDRAAAEQAIETRIAKPLGLSLVEAAYGITHLADMNMTYAIRNITIERGYDPREFVLLAFGGAGGLSATVWANELEVPTVVVPVAPANFSAWGLLNADFREDRSRTSLSELAELTREDMVAIFADLEQACLETLQARGVKVENVSFLRFCDMRYQGQEHWVKVPVPPEFFQTSKVFAQRTFEVSNPLEILQSRFDQLHEQHYAHSQPGYPVQVVNYRVSAIAPTIKPVLRELSGGVDAPIEAGRKGTRSVYFPQTGFVDCPIYDREKLVAGASLTGPAIVEEWTSTTVVPPGWRLTVEKFGNLILEVLR